MFDVEIVAKGVGNVVAEVFEFFVKVSIPLSGRVIACVSCALSYCSSSRFRLVNSLSCGVLAMSGSDEVESAGGIVVLVV